MIATNEQTRNWFFNPNETKEDYARGTAEADKSVFVDMEGIARCKYCKAPRMFLLEGNYGGKCHKWLPIACKCKDREESQGKPKDNQLQLFDGELPF